MTAIQTDLKGHCLYMHVDHAGAPLYVGITNRPKQRARAHERGSKWWPLVDHILYSPVWEEWEKARSYESAVIRALMPPWNTQVSVGDKVLAPDDARALFTPVEPVFSPGPVPRMVRHIVRQTPQPDPDPLDDLASLAKEEAWLLAFIAEERERCIAEALAAGYTAAEVDAVLGRSA